MNGYRKLVLFVEGSDDQLFAESILRPLVQPLFDYVQIYPYAKEKPTKVRGYVNQIRYVADWSYIFIADFDQGPCVTRRKDQLMSRYGNLDADRILIVKSEIESWYLAGLDSDSCIELGVQPLGDTDSITKEIFGTVIPRNYEDRVGFMVDALRYYDIGTARDKNTSFDYAMGKHFSPSR